MCHPRGRPKAPGTRENDCGCCGGVFVRRFMSAEEEQEKLEKYREQLKNELVGLEEHIQGRKG